MNYRSKLKIIVKKLYRIIDGMFLTSGRYFVNYFKHNLY